jgi:FtsP/CotA-like multicopper oxidase with cupredoxin domain
MRSLPPHSAGRAHRLRGSVTAAAVTLGLCVAAVAPAMSARAMPGVALRAAPARVPARASARTWARDRATDTTRAMPNDNRRVAGRRAGRVVTLVLEPRATHWTPVAGDPALARPVLAWAEPGRVAEVPGPLVRARVGDTLRLTLRNPLARTLHVVGLADRARADWMRDTLHVAPGDSAVRRVPLTRAGAFWYDAITTAPDDPPPRADNPFPDKHHQPDETLVGAFIVDPRDAPADLARRERVFVIHVSNGQSVPTLDTLVARRGQLADNGLYVNGASWPATERLRYTVGDTVRWRVINAAFLPHPMHLHGFYFRVDARGDASRDTVYAPAERRRAVTELLDGFTTAQLTWVPEREGNWLFHCHLLRHMAPLRPPPSVLPRVRALAARLAALDSAARQSSRTATPPGAGGPSSAGAAHHAAVARDATPHDATPHDATPHDATAPDPTAHAHQHMAGLVVGIHVVPAARAAGGAVPRAPRERPARALDLWVTGRDSSAAGPPTYGYVLQQGPTPPPRDSAQRPGTPIVLARGEPVAITVHNTRATPVAVHWHGMELESRYDGVGGWSGTRAERHTSRRAGRHVRGALHAAARRHLHLPHAR